MTSEYEAKLIMRISTIIYNAYPEPANLDDDTLSRDSSYDAARLIVQQYKLIPKKELT